MDPLLYSGGAAVFQYPDNDVTFTAAANSDSDGAPTSYAPAGSGLVALDVLEDAKDSEGNWCGIATYADGTPIIQGPGDPAPGYYVSPTSYEWKQFPISDPRRYVDASKVPYVVIPESLRRKARGIVLGCSATILNTRNGLSVEAVVADIGPRVGEISVAAAKALGVDPSPINGGDQSFRYYYTLRPGTPAVINGVTYTLIRDPSVMALRKSLRVRMALLKRLSFSNK